MAEGLPARIRVITPSYTKYVANKNEFVSNYTVKGVSYTEKVKNKSFFKKIQKVHKLIHSSGSIDYERLSG